MSRAALRHLRASILVRAVKAAKTQQVKPSDKERRNRSWRLSYEHVAAAAIASLNIVKFWSTFGQLLSSPDICF
jgi:hypothetical protein